jgi:hypothetical protein
LKGEFFERERKAEGSMRTGAPGSNREAVGLVGLMAATLQ